MPRMSPFLCLRRGVSRLVDGAPVSGCFSLPTQRCFHWSGNSRAPDGAFLCLRRGVSRPGAFPSGRIGFSLPTQRCFHQCRKEVAGIDLFSAYAEVFPGYRPICGTSFTFLCLRRGVSDTSILQYGRTCFSLPTQRCFSVSPRVSVIDWLFSAYAEVFPPARVPRSLTQPFLCLRRGVSFLSEKFGSYHDFSLPTQRCFQRLLRLPDPWRLFSAYAEVFLTSRNPLSRWTHFSLPTQRCFSLEISPPVLCRLFSAYAEVFLLRA